jgi:hypothetical protein
MTQGKVGGQKTFGAGKAMQRQNQVILLSQVNTLLFDQMQAMGEPDATHSIVEMSELVDWCLIVLHRCLCVYHGHFVPFGHIT